MKRFVFASAIFICSSLLGNEVFTRVPTATQPSDGPVRVLAIGNSFSGNATAYLPAMAEAGGKHWVYRTAHIAGASFARHMKAVDAFEKNDKDPDGTPYKITAADGTQHAASLKELLASQPWDYVTIQQASVDSPHAETYEPAAHRLAEYVRRHAPQAKLLIHETWAYRADHPSFTPESTQEDMYDALHRLYAELAARESASVIPVGTAFQNVRQDPRWKPSTRADWDLSQFKYPALPPDDHDLNVNYRWDKLVDPPQIVPDRGHSTALGQFLGACVWYEFFFGDVRENSYCPPKVSPADAVLFRDIAHKTVREGLRPTIKLSSVKAKVLDAAR